jgi:hypothetical protein
MYVIIDHQVCDDMDQSEHGPRSPCAVGSPAVVPTGAQVHAAIHGSPNAVY